MLAVVAGALLATAVVLLPQTRNLASMLVGTPPIPAPGLSPDSSAVDSLSTDARETPPPEPSEPGSSASSGAARPESAPRTSQQARATAIAPAQEVDEPRVEATAKPQPPTERYGLEVASFINRDRALAERDRLGKAAGLPVRISATTEDGGVVTYRILLGSFDMERAAEREADVLVLQGLVNEARVVTLPRRASKSH